MKMIPKDQVVMYARIVLDYWPQKKRSKSCANNSRRWPNQRLFWAHDVNNRYHHIKNNVELYNHHTSYQVHVCWCRKLLPSNTTWSSRIHEDSSWIGSTRIHWCQQFDRQNQEWVHLNENITQNSRFTTIRCFSQQTTKKNYSRNMITTKLTTHKDFLHTHLARYGLH